jgi:hypothetical protein
LGEEYRRRIADHQASAEHAVKRFQKLCSEYAVSAENLHFEGNLPKKQIMKYVYESSSESIEILRKIENNLKR